MVRAPVVPVEGSVLGLEQGKKTASDKGHAIEGSTQVVGGVSAGWNISNGHDGAKRVLTEARHVSTAHVHVDRAASSTYIIKTGNDEEFGVLAITGTGPEVTNLLRLDVADGERVAGQRRSRDLDDG